MNRRAREYVSMVVVLVPIYAIGRLWGSTSVFPDGSLRSSLLGGATIILSALMIVLFRWERIRTDYREVVRD